MEKKITSKNCLKFSVELENKITTLNKSVKEQASAWETVYTFMLQNGLDKNIPCTGLESAIIFLETNLKKEEKIIPKPIG